ncbi:MAG: hypothetical protein M3Q65_04345 [Chloroflexota bacterium]|nr:hypothetical protein [Chloroflexota bacterium]
MPRTTATLTTTGDVVFTGCDHPEVLAAQAASIPESERSIDPQRRRCWVSGEYLDLALSLAERYLDLTLIDGPRWRSSTCPCRGALYQVRRLAGRAA